MMLKQVDTILGFAVVMTVVSLLIMISTQIVSSILGLRGKNLADSLEVMVDNITPEIPPDLRGKLVEHALTRPIISDSMLSMKESFWDNIPLLSWFRRRWKQATAIRPDELLSVVRRIQVITFGGILKTARRTRTA